MQSSPSDCCPRLPPTLAENSEVLASSAAADTATRNAPVLVPPHAVAPHIVQDDPQKEERPMAPPLRIKGQWFVDGAGKTIILRGVNLSGANKLPMGPGFPRYSHERREFFNDEDRNVTFVGRPFPLIEADEHFKRLRSWGFNFLRLCTAWEALEHAGPGKYDEEFIDYIIALLRKAKQYGFRCFIDPHQDAWSRHTGGSGAPGWTLSLAGLDVKSLSPAGAAMVHNVHKNPQEYPKMIWPTNYYKLACATMFTLFFAGRDFAPKCAVKPRCPGENSDVEVNVQDYLQDHFINSFVHLSRRIKDAGGLLDEVVVGYDTLNEPSGGYIGVEDLGCHMILQELKKGLSPTPFESMRLGEGLPTEVETWEMTWLGYRKKGTSLENTARARAWLEHDPITGEPLPGCIWAHHGVWDKASGTLLRPDYFAHIPSTGETAEFARDYWRPFVRRLTAALRAVHPLAIMFINPPVNEEPPEWIPEDGDPQERICFAPHWYDGLTLINKHFASWSVDYLGVKRGKYSTYLQALWFGEKGTKQCFSDQLALIREEGLRMIGECPCLVGEIGIPYDLDERHAYKTGDYRQQVKAMDANMAALERNLLSFTIWNYCPDNCHLWGDNWNGEDLSIFSRLPPSSVKSCAAPGRQYEMGVVPEYGYRDTQGSVARLNAKDQGAPKPETAGLRDGIQRSASTASTAATRSFMEASFAGSEFTAASTAIDDHDQPGCATAGLVPRNLNSGGRALTAILRPYPVRIPGIPIRLNFDMRTRVFNFVYISTSSYDEPDAVSETIGEASPVNELRQSETASAPATNVNGEPVGQPPRPSRDDPLLCEIYLPRWHYPGPESFEVQITDGTWTYSEREQRLYWRRDEEGRHEILVRSRLAGPAALVSGTAKAAGLKLPGGDNGIDEREDDAAAGFWRACWSKCSIL